MAVVEPVDHVDHLLADDLRGLDALEAELAAPAGRVRRAWSSAWPKLAAVGLAVLAWEAFVWSGWKPEYILPSPFTVFARLGALVREGDTWRAVGTTMRRAGTGFLLATVIGVTVGLLVASWRGLRIAVGSLITGMQTMPSIAWFPLAIVLFQLNEGAILFVVVIGAAPSIANGLLTGIDQVAPLLRRAGRALGAKGWREYRHIVLPAALPSFIGGLKQGWAFAWRSLMAGELIVIIADKPSIGSRLQFYRDASDYPSMMAVMIVILVIGILADALLFGAADRAVRRRHGLGTR